MYELLRQAVKKGKLNREQLISLLIEMDIDLKVIETSRVSDAQLKKLKGAVVIIK